MYSLKLFKTLGYGYKNKIEVWNLDLLKQVEICIRLL